MQKAYFYIGRGIMYPLALEGALKLKEITYKHCEGYAAGELKHGPLALIEDDIPVIALAPYDEKFFKNFIKYSRNQSPKWKNYFNK